MGVWQLGFATANDSSLGGRSLGTPAGWLDLGRGSLAVNFASGSSNKSILPVNGEEISYTLPFGKQTAFYVPARNNGQLPARLWIAFCGNGSLALDWTTILAGYPNSNDAFLLVDYPGYGKCQGYASIASMRVSSDAALNTLAKRLGFSGEELESRLCTIGHSLGSAEAR